MMWRHGCFHPRPRGVESSGSGVPPYMRPTSEHLILVDSRNRPIGTAEKHAAHVAGLLHRAFSIFLVDADGRMVLQKRHAQKYHSGGLWANACCGHPRPGERTLAAAQRRLGEELGVTLRLQPGFSTRYQTRFANGLTENEIVQVYFGLAPARFVPNPEEVVEITSVHLSELLADVRTVPERYAFWFRHYLTAHQPEIAAGVTQVMRSAANPLARMRATIRR